MQSIRHLDKVHTLKNITYDYINTCIHTYQYHYSIGKNKYVAELLRDGQIKQTNLKTSKVRYFEPQCDKPRDTYDVWQSQEITPRQPILCSVDTCKRFSNMEIGETVEYILYFFYAIIFSHLYHVL